MANQDALNRKLLQDILDEIKHNPECIFFTPKGDKVLEDLVDIPDIDIKSATTHDVETFKKFIVTHLSCRPRDDSPAYELFGKEIRKIRTEDFSQLGWTRVKSFLDDLTRSPFKYFEFYFDSSGLKGDDKKAYDSLLDKLYIKDPFMFEEKKSLKLKKEVKENPDRYFTLRFEANELYEKKGECIKDLLNTYVMASCETGKKWPEEAAILPAAELATAEEYSHAKKGWWGKKADRFFNRALRVAKSVDKRRSKEKKPSLSSVLIQDYGPAIEGSGLVYALTSDKTFRELQEELGEARIADYGRAMFSSSVKHPYMMGALLGGLALYSMLDNIPVALAAFAAGGALMATTIRSCENVREVVVPVAEKKIITVPGPVTVDDCLSKYGAAICPPDKPNEYSEKACTDNCGAYFTCPEPQESEPKVIYKDKIIYRDRGRSNCEDRRLNGRKRHKSDPRDRRIDIR